jgi:hypothetical protein
VSLPTYLSLPVLDWAPDWDGVSQQLGFRQEKTRLETAAGPLQDDAPDQPRPRTARRLRYMLDSRAEMLAARDFLRDTAQGRWKGFWVPTWVEDLRVTDTVAADATTFSITRMGAWRFYAGAGFGREHLAFFPRVPGTGPILVPRKIASIADGVDAETVTIDAAIGYALTTDDLVSFLLFCRADDDRLMLQWETDHNGVLELPLLDLPRETP